MYVSMSRLRIPPEDAPALVAAFRRRARLVDGAEGFVDLQVWQSDRDRGEVLMVSRWITREHFKAYMRSREHRTSHERIDGDLKAVIRLERLEHLHTYEVVAGGRTSRRRAAARRRRPTSAVRGAPSSTSWRSPVPSVVATTPSSPTRTRATARPAASGACTTTSTSS